MAAPEVDTALGRIRGGRTPEGIEVFKGIRYAEPPSGAYRWQPPRPVRPWAETLDALEFGPGCPQHPYVVSRNAPRAPMDEDCLRLNIWRPDGCTGQHRLPVMVWLHGGGFISGTSSPARYDGSAFARSGIILVSIDYRVGRLGFFAHPALEDDPLRGNYGLMDQIEALRWIGGNIGFFGGDAANITLFGESAGAMSIISLLTSRASKGLFHKAIIQSGGGRHNLVPGNDWASAVARTQALAQKLGVSTDKSAASLDALRAVPVERVVEGLHMGNLHERPGYCAPMIDGVLIEDEPQTLFQRGAFHRLPLLMGTTSADLGFAPPVRTLEDALAPFQHDRALYERAHALFSHLPPAHVAQQLAADTLMAEPARFVARMVRRYQTPAWLYRFAYVPQALSDGLSGAPHGGEIEFVFDTLSTLHAPMTERDQEVATLMHGYWTAFARHGQPNGDGRPHWGCFEPCENNTLHIDEKGASHTAMKSPDPWTARLDLVEACAGDAY
ncbi:carboxylesterase/lipase family protein [Zymobacter sp. IVIA_5232.4 C2]|uniref:carboxylesterase/lipase family protein n=1 Tax=Zymobacter sp. IVIA_5232.4 C2 TaxID=3394855 RepID=UPI0039C43736